MSRGEGGGTKFFCAGEDPRCTLLVILARDFKGPASQLDGMFVGGRGE